MLKQDTKIKIINTSSILDNTYAFIKGIYTKTSEVNFYIIEFEYPIKGYEYQSIVLISSCIEVL